MSTTVCSSSEQQKEPELMHSSADDANLACACMIIRSCCALPVRPRVHWQQVQSCLVSVACILIVCEKGTFTRHAPLPLGGISNAMQEPGM